MHPLMLVGLLPDSRQVSRDAAERHAILTTLKQREKPPRPRFRVLRPAPQT
jgi:hypothetical protein